MVKNGLFRDDEIVVMNKWDKREEKWIKTCYPKIGGRLRLAHEQNETISLTTEVVQYDENMAVVKAEAQTIKGSFHGMGMANNDRDRNIAPAILELAETRAIARALRFAGFGVEYCSAEEISHLENGSGPDENNGKEPKPPVAKSNGRAAQADKDNGNGRITNKQLSYVVTLAKNLGLSSKDLDAETIEAYGVKLAFLTVKDASEFIEQLKTRPA